jgi:hypothetical protein
VLTKGHKKASAAASTTTEESSQASHRTTISVEAADRGDEEEAMTAYLQVARSTVRKNVKATVEQACAFMIARQMLPLSFLDSRTLKGFTTTILAAGRALGSRYMDALDMVPSRRVMTSRILPNSFKAVRESCKKAFHEAGIMTFHVTSDGWSPEHSRIRGERFVSLTVHFVDAEWQLRMHHIRGSPLDGEHSASALSAFIKETLKEIGLPSSQLLGVVTDNARNAVSAARLCGQQSVRCACHVLNLVVSHALGKKLDDSPSPEDAVTDDDDKMDDNPVRAIICKVRSAVKRYQQSKALQAAFGSAQEVTTGDEFYDEGVDAIRTVENDAAETGNAEGEAPTDGSFEEETVQGTITDGRASENATADGSSHTETTNDVQDVTQEAGRAGELAAESAATVCRTPLTLISDVRTRWNSTLLMLQRFCKLRKFVEGVLSDGEAVLTPLEWATLKVIVEALLPFEQATRKLSGSRNVTISLYWPVFCNLLSLKSPSLNVSDFPEETAVAEAARSWTCRLVDVLKTELRRRMRDMHDAAPFLLQAAFLDPRHKTFWFLDKECENLPVLQDIFPLGDRLSSSGVSGRTASEIMGHLSKSVRTSLIRLLSESDDEVSADTSGDGEFPPPQKRARATGSRIFEGIAAKLREELSPLSSTRRSRITEEVTEYGEANVIRLYCSFLAKLDDNKTLSKWKAGEFDDDAFVESIDPLLFWKHNGDRFPILAAHARKVLSCPASSVPSECMWSDFGRVLQEDRCRLTAEHAEMLVILKREMEMPQYTE